MRSIASPALPLYLSVGALCAGLGVYIFSPAPSPLELQRNVPQLASLLPVGAEKLAAMQDSVSAEIQDLLTKGTTALEPRVNTITMRRGDTLTSVLERAGLPATVAASVVDAIRPVYNPRRMYIGQEIELTFDPLTAGTDARPARLAFEIAPGQQVIVDRATDGAYTAKTLTAATHREFSRAEGTISSTLFDAASQQGLPADVLAAMVKLFSYDVDFQRDLQKGDRFAVMYEREVTRDGQLVRNLTIRYALMTVGGTQMKLYAHKHTDGSVDYYNEKGEGIRKALLRTPVNGATLTSGFGMRKHPILGYSIMHRGVDFGAPTGTPIMAAGDGVIEKRENSRTYGNYIRVRHSSGYSTAYAHMSRFGAGMTAGRRVRQGEIIGYVGATGRATGPHLHFEVFKGKEQVNPINVKFPASAKLEGAQLTRFVASRAAIDQQYAQLGQPQVAAADDASPTAPEAGGQ